VLTDQTLSFSVFDDRILLETSTGLYWMSLGGGIPVLLVPRTDISVYTIFEDKLLFVTPAGLYWQPAEGGFPVLLMARSDITAIDAVTRDSIVVATATPFDPTVASASILRVPWAGGPAETVYATSITNGYAPSLSAGAIVAGATAYIVRRETEHFFSGSTSLIVLRNGVARERFSTGIPGVGVLQVLGADEEQITIGRWINAGGMREIDGICALAPRSRAAR
jgi:hypothetical protein